MKVFAIKRTQLLRLFFLCSVMVMITSSLTASEINTILLIDDFDDMTTENLLGGDTQGKEEVIDGCIPSFTKEPAFIYRGCGHSLQLDYTTPFPGSFSFYWSQLGTYGATHQGPKTMDLSQYNYLSFWYLTRTRVPNFSLEIHKDIDGDGDFFLGKDKVSKVFLTKYMGKHVPGQWHKITVPFKHFPDIKTWDNIFEIVFVFENVRQSTEKKNTVYIDDVLFGSNYPTDEEEEDIPFPDGLFVDLFMINNKMIGTQFVLQEHNTLDVILKSMNPYLERVSVEASEYGSKQWFPVCNFYEHTTGYYTGTWTIENTQKTFFFLRIVVLDIFGREHILIGPFGGAFSPQQ
ncbi:MAG: hypothetical protein KKH94_01520 [Candidatus Omnitrophica bacterium]|nr:hypothetical protein [Candidatus Omnitrophota bacterium]